MNTALWGEIRKMDKDELRQALQEAVDLWLDKKFAQFGKWSLASIGAASLAALMYFILSFGDLPRK